MIYRIATLCGAFALAAVSHVRQTEPIVLENSLGQGNLVANGLAKNVGKLRAELNPDRTASLFITADGAKSFYGKWYKLRNSMYIVEIENGPEGAQGTARISVDVAGKLESAALAAASTSTFLRADYRIPGVTELASVVAVKKWNRTVMGKGTLALFGREPVPVTEAQVQVDENGSYQMTLKGGGRDWKFGGKWERVAGAVYRLNNDTGPLGALKALGEVTLFREHCGNMIIQSEPAVGEGASVQFTVTTDFDKPDPKDEPDITTLPDFKKPLPGKDIHNEERQGDGTVAVGDGKGKITKVKVQVKDSGHLEVTFFGKKNYIARGTWKKTAEGYSGTVYYGLDSPKATGTLTITVASKKFTYVEWAGKSATGEAVSIKFRPRDSGSGY